MKAGVKDFHDVRHGPKVVKSGILLVHHGGTQYNREEMQTH
jgi:hypothetical protein